MRFAAVTVRPQQPPARVPAAAELVRRLITGDLRTPAQSAPVRQQEVPADLDQRVRLVGEW